MKWGRLDTLSRVDTHNFDVLRLGAALALLVSHSFPLSGWPGVAPLWRVS